MLENKGIFYILLIIVAILTLSLALMAGYLFVVSDAPNNPESADMMAANQEKIPNDNELAYYDLYTEKTNFNLMSEDGRIHVLQMTAKLKYFKRVKGIKNTQQKITLYDSEIKELFGTYFQKVTVDQVSKPEFKEKSKIELTQLINELLNKGEEKKKAIIYTTIFDEWFYQ